MFNPKNAFSGFSVSNLQEARTFYSQTLGLEVEESEMSTLSVKLPGGFSIMLYEKPNHEPATYTALNFLVENIEETVRELKAAGVKFESYDLPDMKTDDDDIFRGGGPTIAWFSDPAGNILSVIEEQ